MNDELLEYVAGLSSERAHLALCGLVGLVDKNPELAGAMWNVLAMVERAPQPWTAR